MEAIQFSLMGQLLLGHLRAAIAPLRSISGVFGSAGLAGYREARLANPVLWLPQAITPVRRGTALAFLVSLTNDRTRQQLSTCFLYNTTIVIVNFLVIKV
jgi:hypothetical protein